MRRVLAFLAIGGLSAQQPETPLFHASTRLVQVNVLVLDKQDKPVAGLKKEDFTITENGKRQVIAVFQEERKEYVPPKKVQLPPNVFANMGSAAQQGVVTVILIDTLNTQWTDQTYGRQQVLKFLTQIQPQDRVALLTLGNRIRVIHDYTNDASLLLKSLEAWQAKYEVGGVGSVLPRGVEPDPFGGGGAANERAYFLRNRMLTTFNALEAVGQFLAGIPGRKNLIWITAGFPMMIGGPRAQTAPSFDASRKGAPKMGAQPSPGFSKNFETFTYEFDKLFRVLNNANVAVYPVDARGLATNPNVQENIATMQEVASRTGGHAFYNRNDLANAIREVQDQTAVSYTLGYYPDDSSRESKFRSIKVKVDKPGLTVLSRKGYTPVPPDQDDENTRKLQLGYVARNPFNATGLDVGARVDFAKPSGDIFAQIAIDVRKVTLEKSPADTWAGSFDVLLIQRDAQGREVDDKLDIIKLNLKETTYQQIMKDGLIFRESMPRNPASTVLRLIVRDNGSGLAGSVSVPLKDIKDLAPAADPKQK